jgi:protein TonB
MQNQISPEEMQRFKNFDTLLQSHKKIIWFRRMWAGLAAGVLLAGAGMYYMSTQQEVPSNQDNISIAEKPEQTPASNQVVVASNSDSLEQLAVPDTGKLVTVSQKPAKKKQPVNKIPKPKESELVQEETVSFVKAFPAYGLDSLTTYLNRELNKKVLTETKGQILIAFTIDKIGEPSNIKIIQGLSPEVDVEIIQLIDKMPNWEPAEMNGKQVTTTTTLPINIQITPIAN